VRREDEREHPSEARAVRDAVAARAHPSPEPAFRARLRHAFVTGRFAPRPEREPRRPWFARPASLMPALAALALAVVFTMNRGPAWRLVSVHGDGRVLVGQRPFTPEDRDGLAAAVRAGGELRTEGAVTLDLAAPGQVAVALGPDSRISISASPGRWWGRAMFARLESGDAYFSTGRAFRGAHLDVATREVAVRAVGTSFAVLRHEGQGSCVCVMEGHVSVRHGHGAAETTVEVPEGMRRVVDPTLHGETLPILDDSVHRLHEQLSTAGGVLGR
jgi:hypothetical protein